MIGQIILSTVCGHATSLQVALGVMLNQQRNLVDQFHKFGVTCTYNELRRFRISAAVAMDKDDQGIAQFDSNEGLVQVVADNFDTQISSQNGKKVTHGLAMIITQSGSSKTEQRLSKTREDISTIKRLKWEDTKASKLSLGDINIQQFHGTK